MSSQKTDFALAILKAPELPAKVTYSVNPAEAGIQNCLEFREEKSEARNPKFETN
jgi:hypothetical protein